jgi:hypothetical protein
MKLILDQFGMRSEGKPAKGYMLKAYMPNNKYPVVAYGPIHRVESFFKRLLKVEPSFPFRELEPKEPGVIALMPGFVVKDEIWRPISPDWTAEVDESNITIRI